MDEMLVVFDSRTGNVERFVSKTGLPSKRIAPGLVITEPFILVTFTTGFGCPPESTLKFLDTHSHLLRGVAVSGNMNWGKNFCKAADVISQRYYVPVILKFELAGTNQDVINFIEEVRSIEIY
jgi:protein involved in ribonucleotide reduction